MLTVLRSCLWGAVHLAASRRVHRLGAQDGPLGGRTETGDKIKAALEVAGTEFIDEKGGGAGVSHAHSAAKSVTLHRPAPTASFVRRVRCPKASSLVGLTPLHPSRR